MCRPDETTVQLLANDLAALRTVLARSAGHLDQSSPAAARALDACALVDRMHDTLDELTTSHRLLVTRASWEREHRPADYDDASAWMDAHHAAIDTWVLDAADARRVRIADRVDLDKLEPAVSA